MLPETAITLFAAISAASPLEAVVDSCPNIHVFGARETTAPVGYGSSSTVVNGVLSDHPGSTSEYIDYPACGGQASCGTVSYSQSVQQGVQAVVNQISNFAKRCPAAELVLVGYSQVSDAGFDFGGPS